MATFFIYHGLPTNKLLYELFVIISYFQYFISHQVLSNSHQLILATLEKFRSN